MRAVLAFAIFFAAYQAVIAFRETSIVTITGFFEVITWGNAAIGTGEWGCE